MSDQYLLQVLDRLLVDGESEVVEFKRGVERTSTSEIGKYFSALANEANLADRDRAWLVLGVDDASRRVVGTEFRHDSAALDALKQQIQDGASSSFRGIHELHHADGRVLLLEIPPAPRGLPVSWNGHYFGRAGESLLPLTDVKRDEIRNQTLDEDWSAVLVPEAGASDLDDTALNVAREAYVRTTEGRIDRGLIRSWSATEFTDRLGLSRHGKLTRAALLLLGKPV